MKFIVQLLFFCCLISIVSGCGSHDINEKKMITSDRKQYKNYKQKKQGTRFQETHKLQKPNKDRHKKQEVYQNVHFTRVQFADIKEWQGDAHFDALRVFLRSCKVIMRKNDTSNISHHTNIGDKAKNWKEVCNAGSLLYHNAINAQQSSNVNRIKPNYAENQNNSIAQLKPQQNNTRNLAARKFFEQFFKPYKVNISKPNYSTIRYNTNTASSNNITEVLDSGYFTAYYQIEINGSKIKTPKYKYPVYKSPSNISEIKGQSYITRKAINYGSLNGQNLEIVWVDSKAKLFFMHIQGSGIIKLNDGSEMRLAYSSNNGFSFKSINKSFEKYGVNTKDIASTTDTINWLDMNPDIGSKIMDENESYIFFKQLTDNSGIYYDEHHHNNVLGYIGTKSSEKGLYYTDHNERNYSTTTNNIKKLYSAKILPIETNKLTQTNQQTQINKLTQTNNKLNSSKHSIDQNKILKSKKQKSSISDNVNNVNNVFHMINSKSNYYNSSDTNISIPISNLSFHKLQSNYKPQIAQKVISIKISNDLQNNAVQSNTLNLNRNIKNNIHDKKKRLAKTKLQAVNVNTANIKIATISPKITKINAITLQKEVMKQHILNKNTVVIKKTQQLQKSQPLQQPQKSQPLQQSSNELLNGVSIHNPNKLVAPIKQLSTIGAQNVALEPQRSIAIDNRVYPYGIPLWVETHTPKTKNYKSKKYHRLFVAQDRGGAIAGAIRGDIFFGRGQAAEEIACAMRSIGQIYALFPNGVAVPKTYQILHKK